MDILLTVVAFTVFYILIGFIFGSARYIAAKKAYYVKDNYFGYVLKKNKACWRGWRLMAKCMWPSVCVLHMLPQDYRKLPFGHVTLAEGVFMWPAYLLKMVLTVLFLVFFYYPIRPVRLWIKKTSFKYKKYLVA